MAASKKVPVIRFNGFEEEWEEKTLGELMTITSVKRILQSDWTDKGVRFLRARDIVAAYKNEKVADALYISNEKYAEYSLISGKVQEGDLLVTGVGTIGIPLLISTIEPLYFKDGNIIWFKNEKKVFPNFFYYSFINSGIQKFIFNSAGIGTVGTYTIESGKKTPIQLPVDTEQSQIGNYFKQLDGLIRQQEQKLQTVANLKKAMLEKMFPKDGADVPEVRFSGFTEKWGEKKLGDVTELLTGNPFESKKFLKKGILLVRGMNVKRGYLDVSEDIAEYWPTSKGLENYLLKENDIVIQMDGALIGKSYAKIVEKNLPALLVQRVTRIRCSNINAEFIYQKIQRDFLRHISGIKTETAVPHLSLNDIRKFNVDLPSQKEEQQKIGTYFQNLDHLIDRSQQKIAQLKHLKQALLQKMFI